MHSPHEIVAACDTLKSLPAVYHRIREALEAPDSSLTDVARLIAHDGVIAGRVLQVVNSPLYGFSGQIGDIMRAVQILGMQQLHDIVLAMSLGKVFENVAPERMDMRTYWRLSVLRRVDCAGHSKTLWTARRRTPVHHRAARRPGPSGDVPDPAGKGRRRTTGR